MRKKNTLGHTGMKWTDFCLAAHMTLGRRTPLHEGFMPRSNARLMRDQLYLTPPRMFTRSIRVNAETMAAPKRSRRVDRQRPAFAILCWRRKHSGAGAPPCATARGFIRHDPQHALRRH